MKRILIFSGFIVFPVELEISDLTRTAIDQLEVVRRLQAEWSDNSVSCTVYYRKEELPAIKEYLAKYFDKNFKTLSFLLHQDHGFAQSPLEEITKEEFEKWLEIIKQIKPLYVMLYPIDRVTPESELEKLTKEEIQSFADILIENKKIKKIERLNFILELIIFAIYFLKIILKIYQKNTKTFHMK